LLPPIGGVVSVFPLPDDGGVAETCPSPLLDFFFLVKTDNFFFPGFGVSF